MLTENNENIVDIDLSVTNKKRFRINGNNDQILELNTSDMGIINRINEINVKMQRLADKAIALEADKIVSENSDDDEHLDLDKISNTLKEIDNDLRECVDYIFDSNVSEVCAPNGTMFDVFEGKHRFEHIIEKLLMLYTDNIKKEYDKINRRVQSHTSKYTKKRKK